MGHHVAVNRSCCHTTDRMTPGGLLLFIHRCDGMDRTWNKWMLLQSAFFFLLRVHTYVSYLHDERRSESSYFLLRFSCEFYPLFEYPYLFVWLRIAGWFSLLIVLMVRLTAKHVYIRGSRLLRLFRPGWEQERREGGARCLFPPFL